MDVSFILILSKARKQNQDDLDVVSVCVHAHVCVFIQPVCAIVHTCGGHKTILDVGPHFTPC